VRISVPITLEFTVIAKRLKSRPTSTAYGRHLTGDNNQLQESGYRAGLEPTTSGL